jgi:hypothetical protein
VQSVRDRERERERHGDSKAGIHAEVWYQLPPRDAVALLGRRATVAASSTAAAATNPTPTPK